MKRFHRALQEEGIEAAAALKQGALITRLDTDVHLAGGRFDSERMLRLLNEGLEAALNSGYQGLRTCGDMSWLLDDPSGAEQIVEYEALLNGFFRGARAIGMCLYDRGRLAAATVDHGRLAFVPSLMNQLFQHEGDVIELHLHLGHPL